MPRKAVITSHAYIEVLRDQAPDGGLHRGPKAVAKARPHIKPIRETESAPFRVLTGHEFAVLVNLPTLPRGACFHCVSLACE